MERRPTRSHGDRGLEWFSAIVMIGWALVLIQPGDTIGGGNLRELLRHGLTEQDVSAVFGLAGGARVAALFINGRWPRTPIVRMIGATAGFVLWSQIALFLYAGPALANGAMSTGVAVYLPLALADLFSIFRAAYDVRYQRR